MQAALLFLAGLTPLLGVFGIMFLLIFEYRRRFKTPFIQHLLRPPGESLRLRIDELSEKLMTDVLILLICAMVAGFGLRAIFKHALVGGVVLAISLPPFLFFTHRLWQRICLLRDCNLGFLGERAVGEELNSLLADGWKVFHDVEFDEHPGQKTFNVDHVVVGPGGLFAIETKTRSKQALTPRDHSPNIVVFDGSTLEYPWGREDFGIRDARERSQHLSQWLTKSLQTVCSFRPVLALPGWFVKRTGKSDLHVVSGRELGQLFDGLNKRPVMDPVTVRAICALLDQKCRDVGKDN